LRPVHLVRVPVITLLTVLTFSSCNLFIGTSAEGAASLSEIERRLGLAPFAYVTETELNYSNTQLKIIYIQWLSNCRELNRNHR
jgi:hypothetical protein